MHVYLIHHAEAVGPEVDAQQPLSWHGQRQAELVAEACRGHGAAPTAVWHSGKLRARETAMTLWRACAPSAEFKMIRGLTPGDPPDIALLAIQNATGDVMLVGHLPQIDELRARMAPEASHVPLNGALALEMDAGAWREIWRVSPESD